MPVISWLITYVGLVGKVLNKVIYNYPISGTMSTMYKFIDNNAVNFTTSTVVGWTDIFTREMYKTILLDSVRHCQQSQGLKIHAWVLMTNPARMTGRTGIYIPFVVVKKGRDLGLIGRNIKSFTAMKLIDAVINNSKESRKEYLLHTFATEGKKSSSNFKHKF